MKIVQHTEGLKGKSNSEINLIALALSQEHPGRVAELLGHIPEGSFIDEVYHSQLKIRKSQNY